jgi:D-alanine transaminase/branched-chain amino acid aminotransferase
MNMCFLNNKIVDFDSAKVSIKDIGLLRGFGVYEAMTTYNGKPFHLKRHLLRFRKSADFLDIKVPLDDTKIEEIILDLISQNGKNKRYNVKFILTGGESIGGIDYNKENPTFCIFLEEYKPIDEEYMEKGCKVLLVEYLRDFPEMKTTNYIKAVTLQANQKKEGALESLYFWKDKILECSTSNFFMVKNNVLITPNEKILDGITRQVVIELALKLGIEVEEREVGLDELFSADEAFLTASFKEVVPVVFVGEKMIGDGNVGEITKKLILGFKGLIENY